MSGAHIKNQDIIRRRDTKSFHQDTQLAGWLAGWLAHEISDPTRTAQFKECEIVECPPEHVDYITANDLLIGSPNLGKLDPQCYIYNHFSSQGAESSIAQILFVGAGRHDPGAWTGGLE